jgi:hypothetical protein
MMFYNHYGADYIFFSFGATAPIWAFAYLHETRSYTSVF